MWCGLLTDEALILGRSTCFIWKVVILFGLEMQSWLHSSAWPIPVASTITQNSGSLTSSESATHLSGVINFALEWDLPPLYPVKSGLIYNWQCVSKFSGQQIKSPVRFVRSALLIVSELLSILSYNIQIHMPIAHFRKQICTNQPLKSTTCINLSATMLVKVGALTLYFWRRPLTTMLLFDDLKFCLTLESW